MLWVISPLWSKNNKKKTLKITSQSFEPQAMWTRQASAPVYFLEGNQRAMEIQGPGESLLQWLRQVPAHLRGEVPLFALKGSVGAGKIDQTTGNKKSWAGVYFWPADLESVNVKTAFKRKCTTRLPISTKRWRHEAENKHGYPSPIGLAWGGASPCCVRSEPRWA